MRVISSAPHIKHALPGRLRLHVPQLSDAGARHLEIALRQRPGVQRVRVNVLTASVLIHYDPQITSADELLRASQVEERPRVRPTGRERRWLTPTLRRGLTMLAMMENAQAPTRLLLDSAMRLPALAEPRPEPRAPLEAVLGAAAAAVGVGLARLQQLLGKSRVLVPHRGLATAAGCLALLGHVPAFRRGLQRLLGARRADLLLLVADLVSSALGGGLLGLGINLLEVVTHLPAARPAARLA